jgi:hypothetical protein
MINSGREWDWMDNIMPEKKLKKASKRFAYLKYFTYLYI